MADDEKSPETDEQKPSEDVKEITETKDSVKKDKKNKTDKGPNKLKRLWSKYLSHKKWSIPLTVLVVLAVILAIPVTRFAILGNFIKGSFELGVNDDRNFKEVSGASVTIDNQTVTTDASGHAKFKNVKPGKKRVHVEKKYYTSKDVNINVNFGYNKYFDFVHITATGRLVPVVINNKITGKPIAGAQISASGTDAKTDKNGKTTIVVPADKATIDAKISLDGYNQSTVTLNVTAVDDPKNVFSLVPTGKVYFLSKRTGKINVMKSDLDGQNATVVLAAQGTEEDRNTVLLASRDWQRLALLSRRGTSTPHLYLIDTTDSDKLTEIDGGDNATIAMTGWSGHYFIYQVTRDKLQSWEPNKVALKSFNADNKQLATIDQTGGEGHSYNGYAAEYFGNTFLLNSQVVYTKYWNGNNDYAGDYLGGKYMGVYKVNPGGAGKTTIKNFPQGNASGYISAILDKPEEIYFDVNLSSGRSFWEYDGTNFKTSSDVNEDSFKAYPTYLQSPSGSKTFWFESRDGKNSLFVGDGSGAGGKEIARLSDYVTYGWFSEDYLLVSKNGSELFIMSVDGAGADNHVIKITDYHKPDASFYGYGGGYGGI